LAAKDLNMKTYQKKQSEIARKWHLVDVKDKVLGREASQIATLLIGKHKTTYTPHIDDGDFVVVVNAAQVDLTGKKKKQKVYYRHSGYPKGLKEVKIADMMDKNPKTVIELAVNQMLPSNKLKKIRLTRLKIYNDDKHPYSDKFKS